MPIDDTPKSWVDDALDDPSDTYATPADVLRDHRLDTAGARAVLLSWEQHARRKSMAGAETPELRDVAAALSELDRRENLPVDDARL